MARKTPAKVRELMKYQQSMMRHVDEVLAAKRKPIESQVDWIKSKSEEYWIGLADGCDVMLEHALHEHGCYAGFQYQAAVGYKLDSGETYYPIIGPDHFEYQGWRRIYGTRD